MMMYRKLLLTPLVLAAWACASDGTSPDTTNLTLPPEAVYATPQPEIIPYSEERLLVRGKPRAKAGRTVKPKTVNAVTIFPFEEGRIYPIAVSPGYVTVLHLAPDEVLPGKVALGNPDKTLWLAEKTRAGSDKGPIYVVTIRVGDVGISTNMLLATSRRTYLLDMTSYAKRAMDIVAWTYPEPPAGAQVSLPMPDAPLFDPGDINRNYSIALVGGDMPRWFPLAASDYHGKSYVEFPKKIGEVSAPLPFLIEGNGAVSPAPFRIKGGGSVYEIDRIFSLAELRQGETVVRITRGRENL